MPGSFSLRRSYRECEMTATYGEAHPGAGGADVEPDSASQPVSAGVLQVNHRINFGGRREVPWLRTSRIDGADLVDAAVDPDLLRDTRVLVVDDCTLYREYLADVISAHGATFTGVAWDLASLLSSFEDILPRVVLINMATSNSDELLRQALALGTQVRVVVTGLAEDDESRIVACAEAGVAGYHLRNESLIALLDLVERVARGETLCSPRVTAILLRELSTLSSRRPSVAKELVLTDRESQILSMLELGLSNRDIAAQLHIAVHTVKNHVHSVLRKLGVATRAQAGAVARDMRSRQGDRSQYSER
jgi:DNA-binding NarL/FixJ family response regulator